MMRALFLLLALALPLSPAFADKAENCAAFAGLAGKAVELRATEGTDQLEVTKALRKTAKGKERKFMAEIPMIVGWIYTLPEDQLSPDVADAARAQCMAAG